MRETLGDGGLRRGLACALFLIAGAATALGEIESGWAPATTLDTRGPYASMVDAQGVWASPISLDTRGPFSMSANSIAVWYGPVAFDSRDRFLVDVTVSGHGTVEGAGWLLVGSDTVLSASGVGEGLFIGWSGDLTTDRFATNLSLRVDRPYSLTANFSDDPDSDGLSNGMESESGTDPWDPDTDRDGFDDGWEVIHGLSPKRDDSAIMDYIRAHQSIFGLYSQQDIGNLAMGAMTVGVSNGTVGLSLQLRVTQDLDGSWTNAGSAVQWNMPVSGNRKFYRVWSGER